MFRTAQRVTIITAMLAMLAGVACSGGDESTVSPTSTKTPLASKTCSPSPSVLATPTPIETGPPLTGSLTPTPSGIVFPTIGPGSDAWVSVSVATLWRSPDAVRAVDEPALENPARIRDWLAMSDSDKVDLDGRADSQALLGDRVTVLSTSGDWAEVVIPDQATPLDARGYHGWMPLRQLAPTPASPGDQVATVTSPTAWLTMADGTPVLEVSFGTRLPAYTTKPPMTPSAETVPVGLGPMTVDVSLRDVALAAADAPALPQTGQSIVDTAKEFLGVPYLWAGTSGFGFDCSGFVYQVYKAHGITLPRDAEPQSHAGAPVSRDDLQPGDLVFFYVGGVVGHVGIYAGDGQFIHSPATGQPIQMTSLDSQPYASAFAEARRVLP